MKLANKLMFSCHNIAEVIAQDKPLSRRERLKFRLHLLACGVCRSFFKLDQILQKKIKEIYNSSQQNISNENITKSTIQKKIDKK